MTTRRTFLLAGSALLLPQMAKAQQWPAKPIRAIVPFGAGSTIDVLGRIVLEPLSAALGQPIVLENRPGAGGNVGAAFVARAPADGHTLIVGTDAMMTSDVHLYQSMAFDPVKDFAPITNGGANIIVLAAHQSVPASNIAELIAHAKANPGMLKFGSSGIASPHHLAGELLKLKANVEIVHVPYRGGALSAPLPSPRVARPGPGCRPRCAVRGREGLTARRGRARDPRPTRPSRDHLARELRARAVPRRCPARAPGPRWPPGRGSRPRSPCRRSPRPRRWKLASRRDGTAPPQERRGLDRRAAGGTACRQVGLAGARSCD